VADDFANRSRSQYRVEFTQATNNNSANDRASFRRSGFALELSVLLD
jgi:hypothetical protein